jgi:hypothetical protein
VGKEELKNGYEKSCGFTRTGLGLHTNVPSLIKYLLKGFFLHRQTFRKARFLNAFVNRLMQCAFGKFQGVLLLV